MLKNDRGDNSLCLFQGGGVCRIEVFIIRFLKLSQWFFGFHMMPPNFKNKELLILLSFCFHYVLEMLKNLYFYCTHFHLRKNLHFMIRNLHFVIEYMYAWISNLLCDTAFMWWPRELSCRVKKWLILGDFAIWTALVLRKVLL